jgi:toxin ParE1/3/4
MAKIIWTAGALQDLDEIANYIAQENADAANKLVAKVFARVELLEAFPELGRFAPELSGHIHRQLVVAPCKIIYKIEKDAAFIELVIRGERLLREELLQRKF